MAVSIAFNTTTSRFVDKLKHQSPTHFTLYFLLFIALVVYTQNYVKYSHTTEFAPRLSFYYNIIIYSSFALFTSSIIWVSKRIPFDSNRKLLSVVSHLVISLGFCLLHMMFCNIVLYVVDLVSGIPFLPFIKKYLTGVIQIHVIVYWAVHAIVSLSIKNRSASENEISSSGNSKFKVSMNNEQYFVPYKDIYWIEALDHYQKLHEENSYHIINDSMKNLEDKVPSTVFCRVHRSYFVNTAKIKSIYRDKEKGCFVKLNDTLSLKVSESYRKQLLTVLQHQN